VTSRADRTAAVKAASDQNRAYLAALPPGQRAALEALRGAIMAVAPDAVEAVSYGAPAFRYRDRPLVAYAAAASHLSFFPMDPAILDLHRDELVDFELLKGTVRFTSEHPIPASVVVAIVKERVARIDG
jgi:uncharacterized protein YdhG (YjbR/CyaY superfamily)